MKKYLLSLWLLLAMVVPSWSQPSVVGVVVSPDGSVIFKPEVSKTRLEYYCRVAYITNRSVTDDASAVLAWESVGVDHKEAVRMVATQTILQVPQGGTGDVSFTKYGVVVGGTNCTAPLQQVSNVGATTGWFLKFTGACSLPVWAAAGGGGGGMVVGCPVTGGSPNSILYECACQKLATTNTFVYAAGSASNTQGQSGTEVWGACSSGASSCSTIIGSNNTGSACSGNIVIVGHHSTISGTCSQASTSIGNCNALGSFTYSDVVIGKCIRVLCHSFQSVVVGRCAELHNCSPNVVIVGECAAIGSGTGSSVTVGKSVHMGCCSSGSVAVGACSSIGSRAANSIVIGPGSVVSCCKHGDILIGSSISGGNCSLIVVGNCPGCTANCSILFGNHAGTSAANQMILGSAGTPIYDAYLGNGPVDATPHSSTLHATGGEGTCSNGANLTLAGGCPGCAAKYGQLALGTSYATQITAPQTSCYSASNLDNVIPADATSGTVTVTLPDATTVIAGTHYVVKKIDSSVNAVTVATTGGQTIDGSGTYSLAIQWKYVEVVSNGSNWYVIANN
jgi:hypothetical protein